MQKHNRSVFTLGALAAIFAVASFQAHAQYSNDPTDLYTSPNLESGIAIPSGGINPGPANLTGTTGSMYNPAVSAKPATGPADTTNLLGCGGVGQGEYTSALFNMPETFGKFQQDVNSMLAKQILAMNYIMPQTAALFDQLNNFGDQRYQIFQKGCNLDGLRQNAKDQYLKACVEDPKRLNDRKNIIKKYYADGPKGQEGDAMPERMINAMAYAQVWEICTNQYVSDTTVLDLRKKETKKFVEEVRRVENVTRAIVPLLCPAKKDNTDDSEEGCWQELLIPQVRMCLEGAFPCDSKEGAYAVNEPIVSMQRMYDTLRFIGDDLIMARRVNKFTSELNKFSSSMVSQAAKEAALSIGYTTLFRMEAGSSGVLKEPALSSGQIEGLDKSVRDFQIGYLNCQNADIMLPLKTFSTSINKAMDRAKMTAPKPELPKLVVGDYKSFVKLMQLKTSDNTDISQPQADAFANLAWSALGCTANHTVPLFDPNIVASLSTSCLPQDRYAFYSMASNDAAISATRDIYRYLNNRLKQAYARLMVETAVPVSSTEAGDKVPPTISPELNRRLATVVKEVMIPYVESQLARLDDAQNARGEFAQRVQQIYSNRSGCVYGAPASEPNQQRDRGAPGRPAG